MVRKLTAVILSLIIMMNIAVMTPIAASAEETTSVNTNTDELNVIAVDSLGAMLTAEYEENLNEEECYGNKIYEITVADNVATVELQTLTDAMLIVAIYDESGKEMYGSGIKEVGVDDIFVEVALDITTPEYFLIRAYLLDAETNVPLCKQYECDTYTQTMQEFLSKSTKDFNEEKVLNLDDSETNNFLVFNDETILIESDENTNVVTSCDQENQIYVIENIDESVSSLVPGDIFSCKHGENNTLIIKIASIEIDDTTATISGEYTALEDAFQYIKIEADQGAKETSVDNSQLQEGIEYVEDTNDEAPVSDKVVESVGADIDEEFSGSASLKYNLDGLQSPSGHINLSGSLGLEADVEFKCYYDIKWGKEDDVEFSFIVKYEVGADVTLEFTTATDEKHGNKEGIEIKLGEVSFAPVPAVVISFTPAVVIEGNVTVELKGVLSGQVGKEFKNGVFDDVSKEATFYSELTIEGEVAIGISLKPEIGVPCNIISIGANLKQGVKICASLSYSSEDEEKSYPDERHVCKHCIEGEIDWFVEISFELEILEAITFEATAFSWTKKLKDFYFSIDNLEFGWGSCPNYEFKQDIKILDSEHKPIKGALVNGVETSERGRAIIYLTKDYHEISVEQNNIVLFKEKILVDGADDHIFTLRECDSFWKSLQCIVAQKTATPVSSGKCSDTIDYTLYDNGMLVISGTGAIDDYSSDDESPFKGNTDIKKVVVKRGVTSIGDYTFSSCTNLTKVSLPTSVTSIGDYAFNNCKSMVRVNLPISLTSIGNYAFAFCSSLPEANIPDSVSTLNAHSFHRCTALKSINIPDSLETIEANTFYGCTSLEKVTIPGSVSTINGEAFRDCKSLSSIIIPGNVSKLGSEVFKDCTNLERVTLSNGITYISGSAFENCSSLIEITIPNSVNFIGSSIFENCTNLNLVTIGKGVETIGDDAFYNCPNLRKINVDSLNSSYCSIDGNLYTKDKTEFIKYSPNKNNTSLTLPLGVQSIADNALYNCTNLVNVTIPNTVTKIGKYAFKDCTKLASIVIPDSVKTLGYSAFNGCTKLKSVTLGNGIQSFGAYAFTDCSSLETLSIGNFTAPISANAFQRCSTLKNVTIPDSVTNIGNSAFSQCTNLSNVVIGSGIKAIGEYSFSNCSNLSDITINANIESVGNSAFSGCKSLTSFVLPNSVKTIGDYAFYMCSALTNITMSTELTGIGKKAFYQCTKLLSIEIPNKVATINTETFTDCISLKNVSIGSGVNSIGSSAFKNCWSLAEVILPEHVTKIGGSAFYGCSSLSNILIGDNVDSIGGSAFYKCISLQSVVIPQGVNSIESSTFYACSSLSTIDLPLSVTNIKTNAFYNCLNIDKIYYHGTIEQWNSINLYNNRELLAADIICYGSNPDESISPLNTEKSVQELDESTQKITETNSSVNIKTPQLINELIVPEEEHEEYSRTNLVPGTEAVLIILEEIPSESEDDLEMNSSTLLYISQTTVDENGTATFNVCQDLSNSLWTAYVFGECTHASTHTKTVIEPNYYDKGFIIHICDYCGEIIDGYDTDRISLDHSIGDIDLDDKITVRDASAIQKYLVGVISLTDEQLLLADVNGDGSVNIIDSTEIQKYLVELPSCFDD